MTVCFETKALAGQLGRIHTFIEQYTQVVQYPPAWHHARLDGRWNGPSDDLGQGPALHK